MATARLSFGLLPKNIDRGKKVGAPVGDWNDALRFEILEVWHRSLILGAFAAGFINSTGNNFSRSCAYNTDVGV